MMQTLSQQNLRLLRFVQRNFEELEEIHKRAYNMHCHLWSLHDDDDFDEDDEDDFDQDDDNDFDEDDEDDGRE